MHAVTECRAEANYTLWLRFNDGLEGHVYLGDIVHTQYFRMLCDIDTFNRVEVDPVENTVSWEGGIKIELFRALRLVPIRRLEQIAWKLVNEARNEQEVSS